MKVSLAPLMLSFLRIALTNPQEVLALRFVMLAIALKFLNAAMNGNRCLSRCDERL